MQKDTFKSWKTVEDGIVIRGEHCEMTVTFLDLAAIADAISKEIAQAEQRLAPRTKPALPPLKFGNGE